MAGRLEPTTGLFLVATMLGCFSHDLSGYYDAAAGIASPCTLGAAESGCQAGGVCVPPSTPGAFPMCARRCDPTVADACSNGLTCDGDSGLCQCSTDTECQLQVNWAAICDPATHLCTCQPKCDGRLCGPDGCGGSCGECGDGQTCDYATGTCVAAFCGMGFQNCASGSCPMNSTCLMNGCQCNQGFQSVFCNGMPCSGTCVGVAYYCKAM